MATSEQKPTGKKSDNGSKTSASTPPPGAGDEQRAEAALRGLFGKAGAVGAAGLLVAVVLGSMEGDDYRRFAFSYLTAFMWALAIGLGAVFWITLQNLVNAKWSVVLRRVAELIASAAPVLALLALPIVVPILRGDDTLYAWANHERVEGDHLLHHKAAYLNPTFFLIRFLFYFGFWTLLSRFFLGQSLRQDKSGAADIVPRMRKVAGPAMILFALTLTFCAFDFLMSLDPYWFSTIFGVYYFASAVLCINSTLVLAAMWLQKQGRLQGVTQEHFHDLGKMMFAFTVFWAYIGFSQFMLIWYANLPEETAWFKMRFAGGWGDVSWALLFLHFVIPFFGLLSRHVKRHRKALAFWACWVLGVVYLDMYWLVMPNLRQEVSFSLLDAACWVGMGGMLVAAVAYAAKGVNLVPIKDPRLSRSLGFENI